MDDTTPDKDDNYTAADNPIDSAPASNTNTATEDVPTATADTATSANEATKIDTASKAPDVVDATSASSQPQSPSAPPPFLYLPSLLPLSPKPLLPTSLSPKHSSPQSSSFKPSSPNIPSFKTFALKPPTPGPTSQLPLLPLLLFNLSGAPDSPLELYSSRRRSSSSNPSSSLNRSPPQAMTSPRTVIDHKFFPHIMDMIIASAPRQALMRLRETSKFLSIQTSPYFPTHVEINHNWYPDEEQPSITIRHKRRWSLRKGNIAGWPVAEVPLSCDSPIELPPATLTALKQTRVLDMIGSIPAPLVHQLKSSFNGGLHTVRNTLPSNYGSPCCSPFPAERVVVETSGDSWELSVDPVLYPPEVRKIVINLRYKTRFSGANSPNSRKVALRAANYPRLREVTFIFKHNSDPGGETYYFDLKTDMLWATDRITYTFVDALDVPPSLFGVGLQRLSEDDFHRWVIDCVKQDHEVGHGTPFTESDRAQADQAIRILAKDEYRTTLHPYDFQLEDMEYQPEF